MAGGLREAAAAVGAVVGLAGILDATIADFSETLGVCFVELLKEEVGRTPLPRLFALFAGTFVREDDRGMPPHSVAKRPTSYGHNGVNSDVLNPSGFCSVRIHSYNHFAAAALLPKIRSKACFNDESTLSLSVPGKIDIQKLQKESFIEDKAAEKFLRYP